MRFANKYKGYDKLFSVFEKFPLRIKKFKSTKWKKIQKFLQSKIFKTSKPLKRVNAKYPGKKTRRRKSFLNNLLVKVNIRSWYRVEKYYENGRRIKNVVSSLFDKSLPTKFFRRSLNVCKKSSRVTEVYSNTLLKPEFILNILLWRLNFFRSTYQASQAISEKKIYVNGKSIKGNFLLSRGDVVTFCQTCNVKNLTMKKFRSSFLFSKIVSPFIEVDYYSNTIVILKSVEDLGLEDFYTLVRDSYSLKKVKDYI